MRSAKTSLLNSPLVVGCTGSVSGTGASDEAIGNNHY